MSEDCPHSDSPRPGNRSDSSPKQPELGRRSLLRILGGAAGLATITPLTGPSGCAKAPEPPPVAQVPSSSLTDGERIRVMMGPTPVEVNRTGDEIRARSLWCTHLGCEVKWSGDQMKYLCPCHQGVYNAQGYPIGGPPPRRLRELHVTIADGVATITEEPPTASAS